MHKTSSLAIVLSLPMLFVLSSSPASAITPPAFLPEPSWVTMVDQGGADARLKGYRSPQGTKLNVVAESLFFSSIADWCFGPDGALYLLASPSVDDRDVVRRFANPA